MPNHGYLLACTCICNTCTHASVHTTVWNTYMDKFRTHAHCKTWCQLCTVSSRKKEEESPLFVLFFWASKSENVKQYSFCYRFTKTILRMLKEKWDKCLVYFVWHMHSQCLQFGLHLDIHTATALPSMEWKGDKVYVMDTLVDAWKEVIGFYPIVQPINTWIRDKLLV